MRVVGPSIVALAGLMSRLRSHMIAVVLVSWLRCRDPNLRINTNRVKNTMIFTGRQQVQKGPQTGEKQQLTFSPCRSFLVPLRGQCNKMAWVLQEGLATRFRDKIR